MRIHKIEAMDLQDLWFQAVHDILKYGRVFEINEGSYKGQKRLEFDYFIGHVRCPGTEPLLPQIPKHLGIPDPVDPDYLLGGKSRSYIEYLMTDTKEENESYTYGERLVSGKVSKDVRFWLEAPNNHIVYETGLSIFGNKKNKKINQIETIIKRYKELGERNNQLVLQIAQPGDLVLKDPPCLRHIDTRIMDGKLHFMVYFRSWDLWGGLPANLAGIQTLKQYMADCIGVQDGEMIVESKGLHLYDYAVDLAKIRTMWCPES